MNKFLLIDGATSFAHSGGKLNRAMQEAAAETLSQLGLSVRQTIIEEGYDVFAEIEKILWAEVIIYQSPAWWMGMPWIMKKYIDEVFTGGHGRLYENDGRTRSDPSKKYGSGGLLQGRQYMLSVTWNAPAEAFADPAQFFEGKGVDSVYFPLHKANQFLGMSPLPTYLASDVMKGSGTNEAIIAYRAHLTKHFAK